MKIVFHGGAREVGRSCIEIAAAGKRLLLDCGLKIAETDSEYPVGFSAVDDITAVFISHAHLDHTGALPLLDHRGMRCPIFATKATKELSRILLKDAFKIGRITHQHLGYDALDVKYVLSCMNRVLIDTKGSFDGISYEYFDAGHIPGSASIYLNIEGKGILYTGDINNIDTNLLKKAETGFPGIDIMICESTYGDRDHPQRKKTEKEFLDSVSSVVARGGSVVIPVFAVGRAQEILLMLSGKKFSVPVYFDGMGVEATNIMLSNPDSVADAKALKSAFAKVRVVNTDRDRLDAVKHQSIIVSTSGMLTGGPVMFYLKYLAAEKKNAVFLTGYQAENTNGRLLLEKGCVFIDGWKRPVSCSVRQFDFSAHSGLSDLKDLLRKTKPKQVFFVHGEEHSVLSMNNWASALGMKSFAPKLGEVFDV